MTKKCSLNDLPGITYNAIGINGAGLYTYLGNEHFLRDLGIHPPDFFAFSLGTNDAYTSYENFNPQKYKENLEEMMKLILTVNFLSHKFRYRCYCNRTFHRPALKASQPTFHEERSCVFLVMRPRITIVGNPWHIKFLT